MKIYDFESTVNQLKPYLVQYLEEHGINPKKRFTCLFPDHNDSTPSCNLVGEDGPNPRFYCYGCGRSGDIFDAVQLVEKRPNLGMDWVEETLKYLAEKYGISVETKDLTEEQVYELDTFRAYRAAAELIRATNLDKTIHKDFLQHAEQRNWNMESLEELGVGTVTNYNDFREALKAQGFNAAFLDEIDLGRRDIFNEKNMIFTWRDEKKRPIGFTSRNLQFEKQKAAAEAKGEKLKVHKYNNQRTTGLKCNIFQKGTRFYGIDGVQDKDPPAYIFEGQTDVVTGRQHGLDNCIAVAGNQLRADHVHLLKHLGLYDIILCFDGDESGQSRTHQILQEQLAGNRDLRVRVTVMPEGHDPDSYLREFGLESFKGLACWSAFEWKLQQYDEEEDPAIICKEMVPLIMNEPSPVNREQQCRALSRRTGITLKTVQQELDLMLDERAIQRSRERSDVLEKAMYELRQNPSDAELSLQAAIAGLSEISRRHDADALSEESFVRDIDEQKLWEEDESNTDIGFELGEDLRELRDILRGAWSKDVFMAFGGKPNHGKTALLSKIAYSLATNNDNVTVIYHSIDDTLNQIIPRFVCIAEASTKLSVNMVRQPGYWSKTAGVEYVDEKRSAGYNLLRKVANEGRLVVKDISHGGTLPFAENLIHYFQEKYPDRSVVYILDNIHKLRDYSNKDERVRFKQISEACKNIALRRRCVFMGSVEYTKLPPGIKPSNTNVAESVQFEYDTNFICHVYNELGDTPDSCMVMHRDVDWKGETVILPRIELIVGKNKITEIKRSLFLDFYPPASDYRYVSHETVMHDVHAAKQDVEPDKEMGAWKRSYEDEDE